MYTLESWMRRDIEAYGVDAWELLDDLEHACDEQRTPQSGGAQQLSQCERLVRHALVCVAGGGAVLLLLLLLLLALGVHLLHVVAHVVRPTVELQRCTRHTQRHTHTHTQSHAAPAHSVIHSYRRHRQVDTVMVALKIFKEIFPQQLGIFKQNFTRLLHVHIYAKYKILFNYL